MCLIIASPDGKRIPDSVLRDAANSNRNGAGVAWFDPSVKGANKIKYQKGLDCAGVQKLLDETVKGAPHVVHFRIATIGGPLPELTHPFPITEELSLDLEGSAPSVLFHNGTYSNWKENLLLAAASSGLPLPEAPWSDSRAVAFMLQVYGKHLLSILDTSSRYIVFDGQEKDSKRMLLWGDWHEKDGFKFSHRGSCAFQTGGATNFQNRGAAGASAAGSAATDAEMEDTPAGPQTTEPPSSSTPTNSRRVNRTAAGTRVVSPRKGHNPWRLFSPTGDKQIIGANETVAT